MPPPNPCTARAAISHGSPCAKRNSTVAADTVPIASRIAGRRPVRSDSEPNSSMLASTDTQYTPNTTVTVESSNCHSRWYTG